MSIPNHFDLVKAMAVKFPELLVGVNDENRRLWTSRVAQTLAAKYPSEGWGAKRADPTRPLSKDVIALNRTPLVGVELLIGAGTSSPVPEWVEIDLAGQCFVAVEPKDWLGDDPPPPPPPPSDLEARVSALEAKFAALKAALA